jgi:rubredoxin
MKEEWQCEICGRIYTQEELKALCWYDGLRCEAPAEEWNEHNDVRCGGIVTLKKETE